LCNKTPPSLRSPAVLPLRYDLVGVGQIAVDVLHLERVGVADLVVGPAVVGRLDHDDITARAAEINGVSFAGELPPDQAERQGRPAELWWWGGGGGDRDKGRNFRRRIKLMGDEDPDPGFQSDHTWRGGK